jgi:hypothetical protein
MVTTESLPVILRPPPKEAVFPVITVLSLIVHLLPEINMPPPEFSRTIAFPLKVAVAPLIA